MMAVETPINTTLCHLGDAQKFRVSKKLHKDTRKAPGDPMQFWKDIPEVDVTSKTVLVVVNNMETNH